MFNPYFYRIAIISILGGSLSGCSVSTGTLRYGQRFTSQPNATLMLDKVTNVTGKTFDQSVVSLLRESMQAALTDKGLTLSTGVGSNNYLLDLQFTEYRPGNAFGRWLLPGLGGRS
jgi:hypothetical protein